MYAYERKVCFVVNKTEKYLAINFPIMIYYHFRCDDRVNVWEFWHILLTTIDFNSSFDK